MSYPALSSSSAGALGVSIFDSWLASTRFALAVTFLFTSSAHFNKSRHDLARMMPGIFPNPVGFVYFTGICEVLGAVGIVVPRVRSLAGLCLIIFLLAILPATSKQLAKLFSSPVESPRLCGRAFRCKFFS